MFWIHNVVQILGYSQHFPSILKKVVNVRVVICSSLIAKISIITSWTSTLLEQLWKKMSKSNLRHPWPSILQDHQLWLSRQKSKQSQLTKTEYCHSIRDAVFNLPNQLSICNMHAKFQPPSFKAVTWYASEASYVYTLFQTPKTQKTKNFEILRILKI